MKKSLLAVIGVTVIVLIVAVVLYATFLIGTLSSASSMLPAAENFVENFYQSVNSQNNGYISNTLLDKDIGKSAEFEQLLKKIYERYGPVKERKRHTYRADCQLFQVYLSIQYKTVREKGNTVETVILKKKDSSWVLIGYHINKTLGEAPDFENAPLLIK